MQTKRWSWAGGCVVGLGLLALGAGGCGGDGGGTGSEMSTCSGTLSGTVSAKVTDCKFLWSVTNGTALIQNDGHITTDDELANNSFFAFGLDFQTTGDARAMTLDAASATVTSASLMLSNPSGAGLIAYHSTKPNDITAMVGTASMTIASVVATSLPGVWEIHGTATATMVPPPRVSYTGTVTANLSF